MAEKQPEYVVFTSDEARNRARFLVEPLRLRGCEVRTRNLWLSLSTLQEFASWFQRENRPNCILFISLGLSSVLPICIARLSATPLVLRLGGDPLEDIRNFLHNRTHIPVRTRLKYLVNFAIAKVLLKVPRYVICVNAFLEGRVRNDLAKNAEIFSVPQFCDSEITSELSFVKGSARCLTVANLNFMSKSQGIVWLIEQLNIFCERTGRPVTFKIAGDGICKSLIEEFLVSFELNSCLRVELLGFVSEVSALYASSDFFLYCSGHDGTPNVLLEAKRWGIPTLVNDYPAFRSIISHGETGLIFGSSCEFQALFTRAVDDVNFRRKLSSGARMDHEARFSKDAVGAQLENVLQRICEQHVHR